MIETIMMKTIKATKQSSVVVQLELWIVLRMANIFVPSLASVILSSISNSYS